MHQVASPKTPQLSDAQVDSLEDENLQPMDTEGFVDMAVEKVSQELQMQTRFCKALVRFLGDSQHLRTCDLVRSKCKDSGRTPLPVHFQRYKTFARHFHKHHCISITLL